MYKKIFKGVFSSKIKKNKKLVVGYERAEDIAIIRTAIYKFIEALTRILLQINKK